MSECFVHESSIVDDNVVIGEEMVCPDCGKKLEL